ncbi:hypothetical protein CVT24_002449 [Panaeolus cyanescens]|uniref:NAD(P)-binding protein n=1 Tax=Panaeolus cyanescens TaxID=181874 RepID=A0A409YZ57_9AGAR|nr:hypothetical protein CVT24_002449 [Panaeolus cyanescens]
MTVFGRRRSFKPSRDLPNLSGRVILVSGANTGIGFETVRNLAIRGATVYLGSRSEENGKAAVARLKELGIGPGKVVYVFCDLSTPTLATRSAEEFLDIEGRLDVLINNAACHIGTFQFTMTLLPLLKKTANLPNSDVRIITLSSAGHVAGPAANPNLDFSTLDPFKESHSDDLMPFMSRYFLSKLANILFSSALQKRVPENIICIAVHPGAVKKMLLFGTKFNPENDLLDLTGKVVFITGANTGIGFTTAKHLARKGAKVYVGARTESKGQDAIERLQAEGIGSGQVIYHECDVSTPQQAKASAMEFMRREDRLDILSITQMMMVNYIGVFVLTTTLLALLEKTAQEPNADVRIVALSSDAHTRGPAANPDIRFNNLDEFKKTHDKENIPYFARYFVSKLALTLFNNTLQRRVSPNIVCISLHPGLVHTSLADKVKYPRLANFALSIVAKTPEEGCYTTLFAAASPKVKAEPEKYKATYLTPVGVIDKANPNALKHDLQDELWATTEKYLQDIGL